MNRESEEFKEVLKIWNVSKPMLKEALEVLEKKLTLIVHGPSFPSIPNEDFGIGSPYSNGAQSLREFLYPLVDTIQLGPWGKTLPGESSYNTHSPYKSLLESINPFFINFKYLTTKAGGELLSENTYKAAVRGNSSKSISYEYVEAVAEEMFAEIYENYKKKLLNKDEYASTLNKELKKLEHENQGILLDAVYFILCKEYKTNKFKEWSEIDSKLPILLDINDKNAEKRLNAIKKQYKDEIDKYLLIQLLAKKHSEDQKFRAFDYIADKQVAIEGPDLWKLQDLILSQIDGNKVTLGVPPDMFSEKGRNWGMDVLDYGKLFDINGNLTNGGRKLHNIFRRVFKMNRGGVRIDHFIGIVDPYVCINDSAEPEAGAGRLYSSPESPILSKYSFISRDKKETSNRYFMFFDKIILDAAKAEGLDESAIIPEDLGAITEPTRCVMEKYKLPSMKITQYVDLDNPDSIYNARNAEKKDIISTGTHDAPPLIDYIARLDDISYSKLVNILCDNLNIKEKERFYTDNGRILALNAKLAELFVSKAKNVQLFFTHFFGLNQYYNKPGDRSVDKWRIRVPNNFERVYFENILRGTAFDFFDALIKALEARKNGSNELLIKLKEQQKILLEAIKNVLMEEKKMSSRYFNLTISTEQKNEMFPKDAQYRKTLAEALDTDPRSLSSVIGTEELEYILKNSSGKNFSTDGIDAKTQLPNNKDFRINLHMHTEASDGKIKVEDLLDKQAEYANKTKQKVLFAITNHDNITDAKEAIRLIAANPKKYENILFVPGVELDTKYVNPKLTGTIDNGEIGIQMETICYGINPFDETLNNFVNNINNTNRDVVSKIIEEYNEWGLGANLDEAKNYTHLDYMGSPGVINELRKYIQDKFIEKGWTWKDDSHDGESIIRKYITDKYGNECIFPATPGYKDVVDIINSTGFGIVGMAHPALTNLSRAQASGEDSIKTIISDLVKAGVKCVELNYQYTVNNSGMLHWIKTIDEFCTLEFPDIIRTGGIDNHGENIFSRYDIYAPSVNTANIEVKEDGLDF